MDTGLRGEGPLIVASKHIQRYTGDQIHLGVQANLLGAFALIIVRYQTVEGLLRG